MIEFCQFAYDSRPGRRQIRPVVTAPTHGQQAAFGMTRGEHAKPRRRMRVIARRQAQPGERISGQRISATLQQDELRRGRVDEGLDFLPGPQKIIAAGTCWHRQIQLRPGGVAEAGFMCVTCSGIQVAPILMDIGENKVRVIFEGIENTIAVVGVYVDVGNALHPVLLAQRFDCDTNVVEHAKTGSAVARGVMQSADRHEGTCHPALDDRFGCRQRCTNHGQRRVENMRLRRCITHVEKTAFTRTPVAHEVNVIRIMKQQQFSFARGRRFKHKHALVQALVDECLQKCILPVSSERMASGKTVLPRLPAGIYGNRMNWVNALHPASLSLLPHGQNAMLARVLKAGAVRGKK